MKKIIIGMFIVAVGLSSQGAGVFTKTQVDQSVSNSLYVAHGELVADHEAAPWCMTNAVGGTYMQYVGESQTHSNADGMTYSTATHDLEVLYAGHYQVVCTVTLSSAEVEALIHLGIAKNGTVGDKGVSGFGVKSANREIPLSVVKIIDLAVGDKLSLWMTSDTTADVTCFHHVNFDVNLIH